MNLAEYWNGVWASPVLASVMNHLWQSTVVAGVAWVLAIALRKNHARVRYWIWMVASVKFLIPFSVLVDLGARLHSVMPKEVTGPAVAAVVEQVAQPFAQEPVTAPAYSAAVAVHPVSVWPIVLLVIWACGAAIVAFRFGHAWWKVYAAKRSAQPLLMDDLSRAKALQFTGSYSTTEVVPFQDNGLCRRLFGSSTLDVPVLCSAALMEPGVFGIFRQVLLMPEGIVERLEPEQLRAIVAHEMCHVRRRDNLTFALHMIVETLFWFFPLAWWIGARLIEERERACDEAVILQGGEAQVYAEGILNVCKLYVEAPAACTAGVTGSDLKKRIVRILSEHVARGLDVRRKVLLGAAGLLALVLPLALGLMRVGAVIAETKVEDELANLPKYDVASIKPHKDEPSGMMRIGFGMTPDGINADGVPLAMIVTQAFGISRDRILNEPDWVRSTRYDMEAKVSPEDAPKLKGLTDRQRGVMLLPVLEDRFGLKFHHETRELNVYTLVVAKGGPKLKTAQPDEAADGQAGGSGNRGPVTRSGGGDAGPDGPRPDAPMPAPRAGQAFMRISPQGMTLQGRSVPIETLVATISRELGATVIDKTGLTDKYDYTLNFMPENTMGRGFGFGPTPPPPPSTGGAPGQNGGPESAPADTPPSLADAVQQQLGLKLVQQKEPVDVVVIDQIQQPSEN